MIVIFAYLACSLIVASQLYQYARFHKVLKAQDDDNNHLNYQECSWLWYLSQTSLAIVSIYFSISSTDATNKAVFIVLSGLFLSNIILGVTFKRIYYNQDGFLYQQRFILFSRIVKIDQVLQSKRTYQIDIQSEILFMERKRALFIQERYQEYLNTQK
ncbi:hypothetical protein SDC9_155751 [bioreactor metagenome]|uniref:Transmembrane protein n=1 Tax=bioreactor metagenome TaxID=1076179 RepID=A0A645F4W7_9ZZZZ